MLKQVRNWLRGLVSSSNTATAVFVDPVLGSIEEDQRVKGLLVSYVSFEDQDIELSIDPDGAPLEESLMVARLLCKSLISLDKNARSVASRDLLSEYNENWRFFAVTRGDGAFEDVANPALTPDEFEATILLSSVAVIGGMLEFCYSDKELFAGHSIFVQAFDGLSFNDTHATLFG